MIVRNPARARPGATVAVAVLLGGAVLAMDAVAEEQGAAVAEQGALKRKRAENSDGDSDEDFGDALDKAGSEVAVAPAKSEAVAEDRREDEVMTVERMDEVRRQYLAAKVAADAALEAYCDDDEDDSEDLPSRRGMERTDEEYERARTILNEARRDLGLDYVGEHWDSDDDVVASKQAANAAEEVAAVQRAEKYAEMKKLCYDQNPEQAHLLHIGWRYRFLDYFSEQMDLFPGIFYDPFQWYGGQRWYECVRVAYLVGISKIFSPREKRVCSVAVLTSCPPPGHPERLPRHNEPNPPIGKDGGPNCEYFDADRRAKPTNMYNVDKCTFLVALEDLQDLRWTQRDHLEHYYPKCRILEECASCHVAPGESSQVPWKRMYGKVMDGCPETTGTLSTSLSYVGTWVQRDYMDVVLAAAPVEEAAAAPTTEEVVERKQ